MLRGKDGAAAKCAQDWGRDKIEKVVAHYSGEITAWFVMAGVGAEADVVMRLTGNGIEVYDKAKTVSFHIDFSQHQGRGSQHIGFSTYVGGKKKWNTFQEYFIKGFIDAL